MTESHPMDMHIMPEYFKQDPVCGNIGFFEVARRAYPEPAKLLVGRAGYDGDGKLDIAVMVHGGIDADRRVSFRHVDRL